MKARLLVGFLALAICAGVFASQSLGQTPGTLSGVCVPGDSPMVTLSWTPMSGASANAIQRGYVHDDGSYWEFIFGESGPPFETYNYVDAGLEPNKVYEYRVKYAPQIPSNSFKCDTTPPIQTHYACEDNACLLVVGAGDDSCSSDADCAPQTHKACQSNACVTVLGPGSDQCDANADCVAPTHKECRNNACTVVNGAGSDQCSASSECTHRGCQNNSCVTLSGPGANTCSTNADCAAPTHRECRNSACTVVTSPGADSCTSSLDCGSSTHYTCVSESCILVQGSGTDSCSTNSDCMQNATHRECRNNACVSVSGVGANQCYSDSACNGSNDSTLNVQPKYTVFRAGDTFPFRVYFDPDGSGSLPVHDVTLDAAWSAGDGTVAAFISPGLLKGKAAGQGQVSVSYSGHTESANFEVLPALPVVTSGIKPSVQTGPASLAGPRSATFSGSVNPKGLSTTVWFEYGGTKSLGLRTESHGIGRGLSWANVTGEGSGLEPNKNYYYRVAAQNANGTSRGEIRQMNSGGNAVFLVSPADFAAKAGETVNFRATYDPDGAGPQPSEDVSAKANWLSSNVQIASHVIQGQFKSVSSGKVVVTAYYNPDGLSNTNDITNLAADAALSVAAGASGAGPSGPDVHLSGGNNASTSPSDSGSATGSKWLIWIAIILIIAIIGVVIIWLVRKILNRV